MVSLLLTLDRFHTFSGGSIVDFEQVNAGWVISQFIGICSPDANLHSCLFDSLHFSVSWGGGFSHWLDTGQLIQVFLCSSFSNLKYEATYLDTSQGTCFVRIYFSCGLTTNYGVFMINWDKVFKNGPSKICGRQPLKNLK